MSWYITYLEGVAAWRERESEIVMLGSDEEGRLRELERWEMLRKLREDRLSAKPSAPRTRAMGCFLVVLVSLLFAAFVLTTRESTDVTVTVSVDVDATGASTTDTNLTLPVQTNHTNASLVE